MNKVEPLKITITGSPGQGKTTFALALADFLISRGLNVSVSDPDLQEGTLSTVAMARHLEIFKNQDVVIETVQRPRCNKV